MSNFFFIKEKKFVFLKNIFILCNLPFKNIVNKKIFGINNIKDAKKNEITFFDNLNYEKEAKDLEKMEAELLRKLQET